MTTTAENPTLWGCTYLYSHPLLMNLNLSWRIMILMVVLCKFYFAFIHGFLVKQVFFFIISLIAVLVSDLLVTTVLVFYCAARPPSENWVAKLNVKDIWIPLYSKYFCLLVHTVYMRIQLTPHLCVALNTNQMGWAVPFTRLMLTGQMKQ